MPPPNNVAAKQPAGAGRPAGKPQATPRAAPTAADLAKGALRRMSEQRLEPTPANYARAWREEGGPEPAPEPLTPAARAALQEFAARILPAGAPREPLVDALAGQRWDALGAALPEDVASPAQQAQQWADLIDRTVRHLERASKGWTPGRKKDSLQHVLASSRSDVTRLQQRLRQLVGSWESDEAGAGSPAVETAAGAEVPAGEGTSAAPAAASTAMPVGVAATSPSPGRDDGLAGLRQACAALESTVQLALPKPDRRAEEVGRRLSEAATGLAAPALPPAAVQALQAACVDAQRVIQHRHHLVQQLGGLVQDLTEGLADLSEDASWVQGQCEAMRAELAEGLNARGVRAVGNLLRDARTRQQTLRQEQAQAREALKGLIHQMLQDIGELTQRTGGFNDNLARYVDVIGRADTLEGLTSVVREMVEETRSVHQLVAGATERLGAEHAKATALSTRVRELEQELRRLSDEVSTDQLTQVANRRGLIQRFDQEVATAGREGHALAVGILDLDNFKKLNDTMGHQTGDEALKFLARRVTETLRPQDGVARYGGEEFVVLLPATPVSEAQQVLTRVQRVLSSELFMHEDKQTFITFSAGVTQYRSGETLEAALQRADEALYEAKRTGKNRTCVG